MNPYAVTIARHQNRSWLVVIEYTVDVPDGPVRGTKLARRYHYKSDAQACADDALVSLDRCPQFYPYEEVVA